MTLTKKDLVITIADKMDMKQQQVFDVIQSFMDEITEGLATGDDVVLRNFGTFHVRHTKPKVGRNLRKPDEPVEIPSRRIVKFKPGKEMKERVALKLQQRELQRTPPTPPPTPETPTPPPPPPA